MTFAEARAQFPVLERYAYLNAGTFGPLAQRVADALTGEHHRALIEGRITYPAFERYLESRARVRDGIARTIGVDADHVALTTSTTESCNLVLAGLDLQRGDEVVTTDSEHFGVIGALAVSSAAVRVARLRESPVDSALEVIARKVTPRTKLIALSHVTWVDGRALPWRELREATRVPVLVDGAQSAGAIPVDATEADFYTVSAQKWLCGPDLTGALYVRDPEALRIALPSYLSQQTYDLVGVTFEPRAGAARFDTHFTPFASIAGLEAALGLRPEWAYERAADTAAKCAALLTDRFDVVTPPGDSMLVSFRVDEPQETVKRLYERGVIVRDIPGQGLVRASCGWWTSEDDLERLLAGL